MAIKVLPAEPAVAELVRVGDGAWVARDPAVSDSDARRVMAYVELEGDHRVLVLWVRDGRDVSVYDSLREAVQEIAAACEIERAQTNAR